MYPRLSEDMVNQDASVLTDPTTIKFFGICSDGCPASGSWICTDEFNSTSQTRLEQCKIAAGGGQFLSKYTYTKPAENDCSNLMKNCYELPFGSTDILFRCLYQYNTTVVAGPKMCTDPPNVLATDDRCVKTVAAATTIKEEPAKEDLIAKQMATATAVFTAYVADIVKGKGVAYSVACSVGSLVAGFDN